MPILSLRVRVGIEGKDLHCLVALAMFRKLMRENNECFWRLHVCQLETRPNLAILARPCDWYEKTFRFVYIFVPHLRTARGKLGSSPESVSEGDRKEKPQRI